MIATPGKLRQFATQARHDARDYRHWAHETDDPIKKRRYEQWADDRDDTARWYESVASRNEITVDYTDVTHMREAAE